MTENLLKDKNNEIYENLETDDNKEEIKQKKRKNKSKFSKFLIIFIGFILVFAGFIYYKYYHRFPNSLNQTLLKEYNELGKKDDENLQLFASTELFIDRRRKKYLNCELVFQFNKDDIDINRLLRAIKILIENHAIYQSYFFKKNGKYHIKFDKNLYPEIIQKTIKESDYKNFIEELEKKIDFPLNKLMSKFYIIQTEKSLYLIIFNHHSIFDKISGDAFMNSLNKAYLNDANNFESGDFYFASLYEYNLKIRKDKKFMNDVKNYFFKNYDLGRTFKGYHLDKDIKKPLADTVSFHADISSKSLRDKIYSIFGGKISKMSMFNMICQLYTLYLYNNMEDHIPEIVYIRHGRNLKFYKDTIGCLIQNAFINYDFLKNSIKKKEKNFINVQEFYDNVKKQFDEQKLLDSFVNTLENYDSINSLDNLIYTQMYQVDEINDMLFPRFVPKYLFGKKLLENTNNKIIFYGDKDENHFVRLFFENIYTPIGIINHIGGYSDSYKVESLKKISNLFFKVADILSDGFLSEDKLIEIKMLD